MSDGLPSDEQLRRIERGVRERIGVRRRIARGLAGTTAGVLLVVGGVALLVPSVQSASSGGGTSAGSAGSAPASAARVPVRCHGEDGVTRTTAPDDPGRIAEACGASAVDFQTDQGRVPDRTPAAPRSPGSAAVVCRGKDGVLDVFPAGDRPSTVCERRGLQPR